MAVTGPLLEKWHWLGSYPGNHTQDRKHPKVSAGAAVCSDTHGLKKDKQTTLEEPDSLPLPWDV